MEWTKEEKAELIRCGIALMNAGDDTASRWLAVASRAVELVAARGGTMTAEELAWMAPAQDEPMRTIYQKVLGMAAQTASLESDLEMATRKRPASFEMEKELEKALAERDDYRQKMISEGGKFMAEMQRADRLNDEANQMRAERDALSAEVARVSKEGTTEAARLRADLQNMTDLRDGYRKAGALEHDRAEKAEAEIERLSERCKSLETALSERTKTMQEAQRSATEYDLLRNTANRWRQEAESRLDAIRTRAAEASNLERFISEHGLPAAMRWVVDGTTSPRRYPCSATCTHDDAANPSHPERVKARSGAVTDVVDGGPGSRGPVRVVAASARLEIDAHDKGAEAMRAACWEAVQTVLRREGVHPTSTPWTTLKAAIEGVAP